MTHPIPQPRRIPFLGNLTSIDREAPTNSFMLLYQQYGEIFRLDLLGEFRENLAVVKRKFLMRSWKFQGRNVVVINTYDLLHEACDDKRFPKAVSSAIKEISALVHDGLFTCVTTSDPDNIRSLSLKQSPHSGQELGYRSYVQPVVTIKTRSLIVFPDRLLMPVFGTVAVRDMFPAMEDVISQLVNKWER